VLQYIALATAIISFVMVVGALLKRGDRFSPFRGPMVVLSVGLLASSTSNLVAFPPPWEAAHAWVGIGLLFLGSLLMLRCALAATRAEFEARSRSRPI
jgi:hypothetical protein